MKITKKGGAIYDTLFVAQIGKSPRQESRPQLIKQRDRKSTRLNSSHSQQSRMPSSA